MSAHHQQRTRERPRYPEVEREIGEDPARFLVGDLTLAMARIAGIRSPAVVDRWVGVEVDLADGPRKRVIGALNRRKSALQEVDDD